MVIVCNCDIHEYYDRGVQTTDGQGHSDCDIHEYYDRGVRTVVTIHGWSGMVTVTVTSMDTVTEGYAQW